MKRFLNVKYIKILSLIRGGYKPDTQQVIHRSPHVDIIKGWAMLTIIVCHVSSSFFPDIARQLLGNPWNVPIFFIIGGFFLKIESLGNPMQFLKRKLKALYIPATIIYGLNVLLHNLFVYIGWYPLGDNHPATGVPFTLYGIKETAMGILKVICAGGSGELTMGAMWFLYTLLYAFVGILIVYTLVSFIVKDATKRFQWMTVVFMFIAVVSCVLSQRHHITISRFSTAATAMFLIWYGMIINKKWQWRYNQWWVFILACVSFFHCILMHQGRMTLAHNQYQDLAMLIAGCTAAIYIWGFIGKKMEQNIVGKFLALMGRESLYLMAFHITGFFVCNSLLVYLGVFSSADSRGLYTYNLGNNGWLLLVYVSFGIATSFAIIFAFRWLKGMALYQMETHRKSISKENEKQ